MGIMNNKKTTLRIGSIYGHDNNYGLRLYIRLGNGENKENLKTLKFRIESMLKDGWKDLEWSVSVSFVVFIDG